MHEIDVAVVGGGPAGVTAAAAAVISGARGVVLIEAGPRLGGSVSAAMHRCLCGLYSQKPDSPLDTLNPGLQSEVVHEMMRIEPASVHTRQMGLTWVLEFPAAAYQSALNKLCDRREIDRRMNTRLTGVRRDGSKIIAIQLGGNSTDWLSIKTLIDCTGAGALLQLIGEDVMQPADAERMLGGFSLRLSGLTGDPEMLRLQIPYALAQAVATGALPHEAQFTLVHPGPAPGEATCKLAVNPRHFSSGHFEELAERLVAHLRARLPDFSSVKIAEMSPRALPRDGRRLRGRSIVSETDVLEGRQLESELGAQTAHAWWPIERWDITRGPTYAYPPPGLHYDIPPSAQQSEAIENLFAAGTCVSATAAAAASLRASGICLATGEAAGRLAAAFVRSERK